MYPKLLSFMNITEYLQTNFMADFVIYTKRSEIHPLVESCVHYSNLLLQLFIFICFAEGL